MKKMNRLLTGVTMFLAGAAILSACKGGNPTSTNPGKERHIMKKMPFR
jgi:hypothetical protein